MTLEPLGGALVRVLDDQLALLLALLGDQILERVDIAVVEFLGVELAGLLLDQRRRHVEQVLVGLGIADVAEIALRLVDLVGVAQRLQHHAAAARLEADDIFLAAHGELADADLLRPPQRLAQDDEGLLGKVVGRHDIIGLVEIDRVDVAQVDELAEVERLAALQLDALDLLVLEQDIFALRHLIALDDLVAVDRADARHHLLIFDPLARRLVDLVEGDGRAALGRGIDLDRDRDQPDPDLSAPCRPRCHRSPPSKRFAADSIAGGAELVPPARCG